jgi:type I restriction enzyme, S subunit
MSNGQFQLPQSWETKKLGKICEIKGRIGYRGYTKNDLVEKGQGAISLSPSNINGNKFNTNECTYISWFKYEESPEIMVFEGDIIFVKTGSTYGKVAIVEKLPVKATINPQFVVLKELKCCNKFLYYAMTTKSFKEQVEGIIGGAATPTLSQTNLADLTIPLPPLPEQQRIVSILDEAFAAIAKAKANAEQNLRNAKELFESVLQGMFEKKSDVWELTTLKKEIELIVGFAFKSKKYTELKDDILLVRGDNIMQGYFRWDEAKRWVKSEYNDYVKYQLKENDILLAMDRPWVKAGLKLQEFPNMNFQPY